MHITTSRLDDFSESVSRHFRSHHVTGPDRIAGNLEARSLGGVGLTRLSYGSRVNIKAEPLGSFTLLQIPIHGKSSEPDKRQQSQFSLSKGQILNPTRPIDFTMHRNCTLLITRFEKNDIETMLRSLADRDDVSDWANAMKCCDLASPAGRALLSQLNWLNFELDNENSSLHRMEQHFSNALLASFLIAAVPELSQTTNALPSISVVRRVEAYMDANLQEPITVADLAKVAGIPMRSLYDVFARFTQATPAETLRKKRLYASREILLNADPDSMTVTNIAMSCGFVHLGRFAQLYRTEFGEKPSTTIAQRKRMIAIGIPRSSLETYN